MIINYEAWKVILQEHLQSPHLTAIIATFSSACSYVNSVWMEFGKYVPYRLAISDTEKGRYLVEVLFDKRGNNLAICDVIVSRHVIDEGLITLYDSTKMR